MFNLFKESGDLFFLREFTQNPINTFDCLKRCLSVLLFGMDFNF